MDTTDIETAILSIGDDTPDERIGEVLNLVACADDRIKEIKRMARGAIEAHIEANGRDVVIGDIRYYMGMDRKTKCIDPEATMAAILTLADGDMKAAHERFLSSDAFKYGSIRKGLEEQPDVARFDDLFTVEEKPVLKDGKPIHGVKKLQSVNERFLR